MILFYSKNNFSVTLLSKFSLITSKFFIFYLKPNDLKISITFTYLHIKVLYNNKTKGNDRNRPHLYFQHHWKLNTRCVTRRLKKG